MIIAKLYTNDEKLFDTKTFKEFWEFEFFVNQFKVPWNKRKKCNKKHINKIMVYQTCNILGNRLLSIWTLKDKWENLIFEIKL